MCPCASHPVGVYACLFACMHVCVYKLGRESRVNVLIRFSLGLMLVDKVWNNVAPKMIGSKPHNPNICRCIINKF